INKDKIKNPHLIYPGDVVLLDYEGGVPRLRLGKRVGGSGKGSGKGGSGNGGAGKGVSSHKLSPSIHNEELDEAIPSIPANIIEPFISRPLVVTQHELETSPYVVGMDESRVMAGNGDEIYVRGIKENHSRWHIYRKGAPLRDPKEPDLDNMIEEPEWKPEDPQANPLLRHTKKDGWPQLEWREEGTDTSVLGYEAIYIGVARLKEAGEISVMEVLSTKEELEPGDRLIPAEAPTLLSYMPHKMETEVNGRIVSFYGGVNTGGQFSVISFNLGTQDGVEPGHVLGLYTSRKVRYREASGRIKTEDVPEKRRGLAFVFRVFDRISYGLVMESERPLQIGDAVRNP
ncbi:MAG: hypothetical protein LBQ75_03505, partial [Zoogloeaceae bacterium]|nr:hypothetical protein [Zoogloeaceae bacterium]